MTFASLYPNGSLGLVGVKRFFLIAMGLIACTAAAGWHYRRPLMKGWRSIAQPIILGRDELPTPDPERYATLKKEVERWRVELAHKHAGARTEEERNAVLEEARKFLEAALPEMMRCWLGTRWDFNGTAEGPGEGKIACGYFVATVLKDAGFRVNRYKLAQQPSQNILRTFLPRKSLNIKVGVPYDRYSAQVASAEPGIRIIGLDSHVAFLVTRPDGFRFIHSSGSDPWCVVDEDSGGADVLRRSNYRVDGLLTADKTVLRRWLAGHKFQVKVQSS